MDKKKEREGRTSRRNKIGASRRIREESAREGRVCPAARPRGEVEKKSEGDTKEMPEKSASGKDRSGRRARASDVFPGRERAPKKYFSAPVDNARAPDQRRRPFFCPGHFPRFLSFFSIPRPCELFYASLFFCSTFSDYR